MKLKPDLVIVFAAVLKIVSRGETPTTRNVISELGYGSPTQVSALLQQLRQSSKEQLTEQLLPAMRRMSGSREG